MAHPALQPDAMACLVRDILRGKDLSQVTAKIVRENVRERLGPIACQDLQALKLSVKAALDVVLQEPVAPPATPPQPEKAVNVSEDEEEEVRRPKKRPRAMENDALTGLALPDASVASPVVAAGSPVMTTTEDPVVTAANPPAVRRRGRSSMSKVAHARLEARLKRLLGVCRQLRCPVPPSRLKNRSVEEKADAVVEFLEGKGVKVTDPAKMTKTDILEHRNRIEHEKELDGLDARYVFLSLLWC